MILYYSCLAAFAAMVLLCLIKNKSEQNARNKMAAKEAEIRAERLAYDAQLRQILFEVNLALRKAHGAGYNCWLSSVIYGMDAGKEVTPRMAVLALEKTAAELPARFRLSRVFAEAVEKVKGLGA